MTIYEVEQESSKIYKSFRDEFEKECLEKVKELLEKPTTPSLFKYKLDDVIRNHLRVHNLDSHIMTAARIFNVDYSLDRDSIFNNIVHTISYSLGMQVRIIKHA